MAKKKDKTGFLLGRFLGGLLVLSVLAAVSWFAGPMLRNLAASLSWPERACRIERSEVTRRAIDDYRFTVSFAYEEGGSTIVNSTSIDTPGTSDYSFSRIGERLPLLERFAPGSTATCRVNPADPFDAVLVVSPSSAALSALVPLVVCLLAAVLGLSLMTFAFPLPRRAVAVRFSSPLIPYVLLGFMGFVFSMVGWTGVAWTGRSAWKLHGHTYVTCLGTVIDKGLVRSTSSGSRGGSRTVYGARIAYAYTVNGKKYEGDHRDYDEIMSSDSNPARRILATYTVGQEVAVWYDAQAPQEALLVRPSWSTGLSMIGFMLLFALAGTGMLTLLVSLLVRRCLGRPAPITACQLPLKRTLPHDFGPSVAFAFFWNFFLLVVGSFLFAGDEGSAPWYLILFFTPFVGVGVFVVFSTLRTVLRFHTGAHAQVTVTASLLQPRAEVQVNWELSGPYDYRALEIYVLQCDQGVWSVGSRGRGDRSQKVADFKGARQAGAFAVTLPEAVPSEQIRWELQFVFRGPHRRIVLKDIFRLPM